MEPFIYWSFFAKTGIKDQQNGPQYGNLIFEGPIYEVNKNTDPNRNVKIDEKHHMHKATSTSYTFRIDNPEHIHHLLIICVISLTQRNCISLPHVDNSEA